MITCTVDYDRDNNVALMLTDTTYSGGFARIDTYNGTTTVLVRYNAFVVAPFEVKYNSDSMAVLETACKDIAHALAMDAVLTQGETNYNKCYGALMESLADALKLC